MKSILIVDDDLGFVFWLGQTLDAAGYSSLPAKGISEAIELLQDFRVRIDVLIARCVLPGASEFALALRSFEGDRLRTIGLIDPDDELCESLEMWDDQALKPMLPDIKARKIFLAAVHCALGSRTTATTT